MPTRGRSISSLVKPSALNSARWGAFCAPCMIASLFMGTILSFLELYNNIIACYTTVVNPLFFLNAKSAHRVDDMQLHRGFRAERVAVCDELHDHPVVVQGVLHHCAGAFR